MSLGVVFFHLWGIAHKEKALPVALDHNLQIRLRPSTAHKDAFNGIALF
jgi:hypothetical protein